MANEIDDVTELEQLRIELLVSQDLDRLVDLLHDDLLYTHSIGFRDSKDTLLASLRGGVLRYHAIEQSVDQVVAVPGAVTIIGTQRMELTGGGRRMNGASLTNALWISHGGRWRLRAFQGTALALPSE